TAVVMAHEAEPCVAERFGDLGGGYPRFDLIPAFGIVLQHAGDLVEGNASPSEDVCDFGDGTGRAIGEPLAGHRGAVRKLIEAGVVDCGLGLEVEHDYRNPGAPDDRQHGGGKRVSGDVQDEQVNVLAP